jgi:uncharacterized protein YbjQ (UPF0145 family)
MTGELFQVLFPWLLILLAMITGTLLEKAHFKRIHLREVEHARLPMLNTKKLPDGCEVSRTALVMGDVVVSIDYFKMFLARLRNIFGGEVKSYASLLDRGRREAILRMKESAPAGTKIIINVRIETAAIGKNTQKKSVGCVEALAYGTALILPE